MILTFSESYYQLLQTFWTEIVPNNTTFSQIWAYSIPLLIRIISQSPFLLVFWISLGLKPYKMDTVKIPFSLPLNIIFSFRNDILATLKPVFSGTM